MSAKRNPHAWSVSETASKSTLKLYNSLTKKKEEFIPKDGNKVYWYSCGPTVYDASHMGHARSYMTFDIMRRVMKDYFGYDVLYVMNITDIDDKIIKNARKDYLFTQYCEKVGKTNAEQVLADIHDALVNFQEKAKKTNDNDVKTMLMGLTEKVQKALPAIETAVRNNEVLHESLDEFLLVSKDILSEWLDVKQGGEVTDNSIFFSLPRKWEEEFHKDMTSLNILNPDVVVRVTDFIPEIIEYIEKIIQRNLAYESNGSVYFDVTAFEKSPNHYYAKLVPEAFGNLDLLQDGEGELSEKNDKRSSTDFALWKTSRKGEPSWPSPWGKGRPGWHIECSVMATAVCGDTLDIHSGGVDLKFPHHDNEIAQAEAYFDRDSWVRYFVHSGHLKIEGCKMSKSLKNFITIKDALKQYSSRQLRFAFLLHSWKDQLDYSSNTMKLALSFEKIFNEFFLSIKDILSKYQNENLTSQFQKYRTEETALAASFQKLKDDVYIALCDSIDTRTALEKIKEFVGLCNTYIGGQTENVTLLKSIATYITSILSMFGLITTKESIGFPLSTNNEQNVEDIVMPYLRILGNFRDIVRDSAKKTKDIEILKLCDELRDEILPNVGVRLEDKTDAPCAVKLVDREVLLKEKQMKKEMAAEAKKPKAPPQQTAPAPVIDPSKMFLSMTDKYSKFSEDGIPTHDLEGNEISKGQQKKLQKLYQLQLKKFEKQQAANA